MGIKGRVKNLEDRTVEIFCECESNDYEIFKEIISVKGDTVNLFAPTVREIKVFPDGSDGYVQPPTSFGHFEIDYGAKMTTAEKESIERSEIGILALAGVNANIKDVVGKQDTMNNKLDTMNTTLGGIGTQLGDALTRYDSFGKDMGAIRQDISDMKLLANEIRDFKDIFARYVDYQIEQGKKK